MAFFSLVAIIFFSNTLFFFMFLLFTYLLTDITVNGIHDRFPNISRHFLLYCFYMVLILGSLVLSLRVVPEFVSDLPTYSKQIDNQLIGFVVEFCKKYNIAFDLNLISGKVIEQSTTELKGFVAIFKGVSKGFIFFLFSLVLNFLLFNDENQVNRTFISEKGTLMSFCYNFFTAKLRKFYFFFKTVMGGQVIISLINTFITSILVVTLHLPHKITLISLVFICGLLPVIGNLISNTIVSVTAFFTDGLWAFLVCLVLLVAIHKLEYFLNSKIIGSIVRLPMFVTLLSLLLGESLMGIPGIILAIPFVLFFKSELEEVRLIEGPSS